jgi:hypothetical protein
MVLVEENKPKEIIAYAQKMGMQAKVRIPIFLVQYSNSDICTCYGVIST